MDTSKESLTAAKRAAGYAAADMVEDGMIVGLGTGSTVFYALERLSTRVSEGLQIFGVPTSLPDGTTGPGIQYPAYFL